MTDDILKLAKILAKTIKTDEKITPTSGGIKFDGTKGEPGDREARERINREERMYKKKNKQDTAVFATIAVLVTVERDDEYDIYLMTENYSALQEKKRWWQISYIKSMPRYFTGAPWYAWGFPGFTTHGQLGGDLYGFLETIPSEEEFGSPAWMETKSLDVNQQLGVSSPLFWDERNPAPVGELKVELKINNATMSGFLADNYVEITHLYEDRYGALSFAEGRDYTKIEDWWAVYPYYHHAPEIEFVSFDADVDIYRYTYSDEAIDFDSMAPSDYTTVIIPLYVVDPLTHLPAVDSNGDPIAGTSRTDAKSQSNESDWKRTDPESCVVNVDCALTTRTIDSELRDFGAGLQWNVSCFKSGNIIPYDSEGSYGSVAVSKMPVLVQWEAIHAIVGVPDTFKSSPSPPEGGDTTIVEITGAYTTRTVNEFRWKWASGGVLEINADSYVLGVEHKDAVDSGLTLYPAMVIENGGLSARNVIEGDPSQWMFSVGTYGAYASISLSEGANLWAAWNTTLAQPNAPGRNCNYYETMALFQGHGVVVYNPHSCDIYYPGFGDGKFLFNSSPAPLTTRNYVVSVDAYPYILFSNGVKHYGQPSDIVNGSPNIQIWSSTDTIVTMGGKDYYYATNPSFDAMAYKLNAYEDSVKTSSTLFDKVYSTRLEGIQNIAEYKLTTHDSSIEFFATLPEQTSGGWALGSEKKVRWYKNGQGEITIDFVSKDCHDTGHFVYDKTTRRGRLGITTIKETNSDRDPTILYKFIPPRSNGDDVLESEVKPELSITYVFAGGKIYSGVHPKSTLQKYDKPVARSVLSNQGARMNGTAPKSVSGALGNRSIVAPDNDWELGSLPPDLQFKTIPASSSIGQTLMVIGTFESEATYMRASKWTSVIPTPSTPYQGMIHKGDGVQWSNQHEYFVPRMREYWGTSISDQSDTGVWLNGWEPMNTVGLSGYLPSGEFRSLSLYHDTTRAKLSYGIKGAIETVLGMNREPLHFVFAYGGIYAVFGKANNGMDDDEKVFMPRTPASNNLTDLQANKQSQISSNPPYPPEFDLNQLMRSVKYTWGGFKNYICPYSYGLERQYYGLDAQLPALMFPTFAVNLNTSGISSLYSLGFKFVDPSVEYAITVNGVTITKTGFDDRSTLLDSFLQAFTGLPNVTVNAVSDHLVFQGSPLSVSVSNLDITSSSSDDPNAVITTIVYLPGINAPYTLSIDNTLLSVPVSNAMTTEAALDALLGALSAYSAVKKQHRVEVSDVYVVKQTEMKDHNNMIIEQIVVALESTDKPWRKTEIKWDETPSVGLPDATNLELSSAANVSRQLKYRDFDYSKYPYAKIEDERVFSVHDATLLDVSQPNKLLDRDFLDDEAIVIKYATSEDQEKWNETTLQCKQIQASWFGVDRSKINIIAVAPSVISHPLAGALSKIAIDTKDAYP